VRDIRVYHVATTRTTTTTEEDDGLGGRIILIGIVWALLSVGYVLIAPQLLAALAFALIGFGVGSAVAGIVVYRRGLVLAAGTMHVIIRSIFVSIVSMICLTWTQHVTYKGASLPAIHSTLSTVKFSFGGWLSLLINTYHSAGLSLVGTLMAGTLFVIMCYLFSLFTLMTAIAKTREDAGALGRITGYLAKFHKPRQSLDTAIIAVLLAASLIFCTGLPLR
jgi:hypothetical protein